MASVDITKLRIKRKFVLWTGRIPINVQQTI